MKRFFAYLSLFFVLQILFFTPFWRHLELKAYDLLFLFRGEEAAPESMLVLDIDDNTFASLNETWPFPRAYHAKVIENLKKLGAKLVVFDVQFTEKSSDDELLAQAAEKAGNVIFSGKIIRQEGANFAQSTILPPISEIRQKNIPWGLVNIPVDEDGFVRRYYISFSSSGNIYKTIALRSGEIFFGDTLQQTSRYFVLGNRRFRKIDENQAYLGLLGKEHTVKTVSYADVLDDSSFVMPTFDLNTFYEYEKNGIFKDKIVFVGASVAELHDIFPTAFGSLAGVELQATFFANLLTKTNYGKTPFLLVAFLNLFIFFLMLTLGHRLKPRANLFISLSLIIVLFGLSLVLFLYFNWYLPYLNAGILLVFFYFAGLGESYIRSNRDKRAIKSAFQKYMAPKLVNELLKDPSQIKYGGHLKEISVLFSDIRNFTTYTESRGPAETVGILREYLSAMVDIILTEQGTFDKFVGDEIMALFGTPLPLPNHALSACRVAVKMRDKLEEMKISWLERGIEPFEIGIGINSGQAIVGNLGSEQIFDYTGIGDTINLGARLEGMNKIYPNKNSIIISEYTLEIVKDYAVVQYLDDVTAKGKTKKVKIYALLGLIEQNTRK